MCVRAGQFTPGRCSLSKKHLFFPRSRSDIENFDVKKNKESKDYFSRIWILVITITIFNLCDDSSAQDLVGSPAQPKQFFLIRSRGSARGSSFVFQWVGGCIKLFVLRKKKKPGSTQPRIHVSNRKPPFIRERQSNGGK